MRIHRLALLTKNPFIKYIKLFEASLPQFDPVIFFKMENLVIVCLAVFLAVTVASSLPRAIKPQSHYNEEGKFFFLDCKF